MPMQDLVDRVAQRTNIDTTTAERAVGSLLSIIEQESMGSKIGDLFARLPGAHELAQQYSVAGALPQEGNFTSLFGSIVASVGGGKIQSLLAAFSQMQTIGLNRQQLLGVGQEIFAYAKEMAGPDLAFQAIASVPGLSSVLPMAA